MMLIVLYSFLFSVAFAYANKVPVMKLQLSASLKEEKTFHRAYFILRVLFALIISQGAVLPFIASGLAQYLVFDIAVNLFTGEPWYYVGTTATSDKLIRRWLGGDQAGLYKMVIVLLLLVVVNMISYL